VGEVKDGKLVPYPNAHWNSWKGGSDSTEQKFICVQSVFVDHFERLWILDPAAAFLGNVTSAKLIQVDLKTDTVVRTYHFPDSIAPAHSYLNDVRISADGKFAFLTDSNLGGLGVLDLESGAVRKILESHPSTHAEDGVVTAVEGQLMYLAGTKPRAPATFQSDGIAVLGNFIYYHAVTAKTLYRIPVNAATNKTLTETQVEASIEVVAASGIHDGMVVAADRKLEKGILFMTAIEKDGIDFLSLDQENRVLPLLSDQRLQWPDSLSVPVLQTGGKSNYLYVTASQVNAAPFIANAKPRRNEYALYRLLLPQELVDAVAAR